MSLRALQQSAALDQLARDLCVNHAEYLGLEIVPWPDVPFHLRQVYLELAARTLRLMCEQPAGAEPADALFHLANALGRAEIATGLGPTHGKVIGSIQPQRIA